MALDSMAPTQAKTPSGKEQVELAVRMTIKLLEEGGGIDVIADALKQSRDPAQVIGQFLAQVVGQLAEKLEQEFGIDPRIFLAKGGWLDNVLDYIEQRLELPKEFSDQVYGNVLETIKAAAMGGEVPEQAPQPQGGGIQGAGGPTPMQPGEGMPQQGLGG